MTDTVKDIVEKVKTIMNVINEADMMSWRDMREDSFASEDSVDFSFEDGVLSISDEVDVPLETLLKAVPDCPTGKSTYWRFEFNNIPYRLDFERTSWI